MSTDGELPRVAHLSSVHRWNDVRIFLKEARSLAAAGYDVTVVAQRQEAADIDGVHCAAIPFFRNRAERMLVGSWRILQEGRRHDICHFHDPELIPAALVLKLLGKRVIYDVHEDVPRQMLDKHWIPPVLRSPIARAAEVVEWLATRVFDRVVAATPTIAARFHSVGTVTICNYPRIEELSSLGLADYTRRPPHFAYVGSISTSRGTAEMIDAMNHLDHFPDARLVLAGNFSPAELASEMEKRAGWEKTEFLGFQDRPSVARLLRTARAGLVVLHPVQNYVDSLPVKLFEYMAAGLPVIASNFPLWRDIIERSGAGLLVDPRDPRMIAEAMLWILQNPADAEAMGRRGREAVLAEFNWDSEVKKLLAMYATLE